MNVCMFVCACVCVHAQTWACAYIDINICINACLSICVHVYVYKDISAYVYIYIYIYIYWCVYIITLIWEHIRKGFTNGPGDRGSIPGWVIPKTQKIVLDDSLLNTQHWKVQTKGKWSNPEKGVVPTLHLSVVAIEKGAFELPSTTVG